MRDKRGGNNVIIMKDMKRDEFIEEKIDSYIEGTQPAVDLSRARRALTEGRGRRSAKRRTWIALASACASLLLVAVVLFGVMPLFRAQSMAGDSGEGVPPASSDVPQEPETVRFSLTGENVHAERLGVNAVVREYGGRLKNLTELGLLDWVFAEYTLYTVGEEKALLETTVLYSSHGRRVDAIVYTDLSEGKYLAEELEKYRDLSLKTATYMYEKTFLNGEYVYLGSFVSSGAEYCVSLQSSYEGAFYELMEIIR